MARALRIQHKGAWYHVMNRGIDRGRLFRNDRDRQHLLELLGVLAERYGVEVHAYVLMDNHYHLALRIPEGNLSRGMQWLNVSYSIWYNRHHRRVGPLFQGRFRSVPVEDGRWLCHLSQYLHLNPVRVKGHGLAWRQRTEEGLGLKEASSMKEAAERLTVLRAYRWSSYRAYAGYQVAPDWLRMDEILGRAGGNSQTVRQRHYRKEVEGYLRGGYKDALAMRLRHAIAVGADGFANKVKQGLGIVPREWSGKRELRGRKTFAEVVQAVEQVKGEKWERFVGRYGDWGRDLALAVARECTGLTLAELGEAAGGMDYAAVSEAVRRVAFRRRQSEQPLAQVFQRANKLLNI